MHVNRHVVTLNTGATASTAAGAVEISDGPGARFLSIHLAPLQTLATTAVLVVTARHTGQVILTATLTSTVGWHRAPKQPMYLSSDIINIAATLAGALFEPFYIGNQAIDLAVTAAGLSKTGTVTILTG